MGLKTFRPLTPASRFKELPDFAEITKDKPEKKLTTPLKKSGGRNNNNSFFHQQCNFRFDFTHSSIKSDTQIHHGRFT